MTSFFFLKIMYLLIFKARQYKKVQRRYFFKKIIQDPTTQK